MRSRADGVLEHVPPTGDTTAPVVTPPADTTIQFANGGAGLAHNDPALQAWLAQASAVDETDGAVTVTNNLTAYADPLPAGTLTIQFSATDAAGNTGTATANLTVSEQGVAGAWQLAGDGVSADSHWIKAKMPMHPIFPRPDSETQSHARHRWAHPDFRYEIPIGVQGGAWPFKYEIINGPSGATIGQYYGDPDYGVLKWDPAVGDSGTKTFTVRVTDQELNTVDLTWTTTIDANQFVFVDASAASTGSGTITSPLKTFADWYRGSVDATDATYHNKIVVFRSGNYTATGSAANGGNVRLESAYKTPSLIGYPNELVNIDCSSAVFFVADGGMSDLFVSNINFNNARADVSNSHFWWIIDRTERVTFWNNTFDTLSDGTVGTDNPCGIFVSNTGYEKNYYLYKGNTFKNFSNAGSNGSFIDMYRVFYVLIEENHCRDSTPQYGIWAKYSVAYVTIRANMMENVRAGIVLGYGGTPSGPPHDHEVCWNKVVISETYWDTITHSFIVRKAADDAYNTTHYNTYIYRNTFIGGTAYTWGVGNDPFNTDGNVVESHDLTRWRTYEQETVIPNLTGGLTSGLTDNAGNLAGANRVQYIGTRGYEVS